MGKWSKKKILGISLGALVMVLVVGAFVFRKREPVANVIDKVAL